MNYTNESIHNDVNGAGTSCEGPTSGKCPIAQQGGPGRHHATARNPQRRALTPSGQAATNHQLTRSKLVSCRNRAFISTFNTRTLNPPSRLNELVRNAKDQNIDIIAIQEHRFFHPESNIEYHKIEDYQLITASCVKNSANSSVGGVGILLSPKAMENLLSIKKDIAKSHHC